MENLKLCIMPKYSKRVFTGLEFVNLSKTANQPTLQLTYKTSNNKVIQLTILNNDNNEVSGYFSEFQCNSEEYNKFISNYEKQRKSKISVIKVGKRRFYKKVAKNSSENQQIQLSKTNEKLDDDPSKRKRNPNGKGSVYYNSQRKIYVGQYTDPRTGKRKLAGTAKTEPECWDLVQKAIFNAEHGTVIQNSNITVVELGKELIKEKLESNVLCENSYKRKMGTLKIIAKTELGSILVKKVIKKDVQTCLNSFKHYSNSYLKKIKQLLDEIFYEAKENKNLILINPMENVTRTKSNKKDKKVRALTLEEHKLFLNSIEKNKHKNIFLIAIKTGLRCGEILALRPMDIDFNKKQIHVTRTISRDKNDKPIIKEGTKTHAGCRFVPFDDTLIPVLKDSIRNMVLNHYQCIFTKNGALISPTTLNSSFRRICDKVGIPYCVDNVYITFHSLRHTFATRCIESGMPAIVLSKILGHADIKTTLSVYCDVLNQYKDNEYQKYIEYASVNGIS